MSSTSTRIGELVAKRSLRMCHMIRKIGSHSIGGKSEDCFRGYRLPVVRAGRGEDNLAGQLISRTSQGLCQQVG